MEEVRSIADSVPEVSMFEAGEEDGVRMPFLFGLFTKPTWRGELWKRRKRKFLMFVVVPVARSEVSRPDKVLSWRTRRTSKGEKVLRIKFPRSRDAVVLPILMASSMLVRIFRPVHPL